MHVIRVRSKGWSSTMLHKSHGRSASGWNMCVARLTLILREIPIEITYVEMLFFCPFGKNVSSSCGGAAPLVSWANKQFKNIKRRIFHILFSVVNIIAGRILTITIIGSNFSSCFDVSSINFQLTYLQMKEMGISFNLYRHRIVLISSLNAPITERSDHRVFCCQVSHCMNWQFIKSTRSCIEREKEMQIY